MKGGHTVDESHKTVKTASDRMSKCALNGVPRRVDDGDDSSFWYHRICTLKFLAKK
jgi:hypothetical protein